MAEYELKVSPEVGFDEVALEEYLRKKKLLHEGQYYQIKRRSVDARKPNIKVNMAVEILNHAPKVEYVEYFKREHDVRNAEPVIIVGAGPAGLFAAIRAIEGGLKANHTRARQRRTCQAQRSCCHQ